MNERPSESRFPVLGRVFETSSNFNLPRFVPLRMKRAAWKRASSLRAGDDLAHKVDSARLPAVARSREWFEELATGSARW